MDIVPDRWELNRQTKADNTLLQERKSTSKLNRLRQHDLFQQITTLTEARGELCAEKKSSSC